MLFSQKNCFVCGRGATAIYLVLQKMKDRDRRRGIIVPANICYAAIYPIIYAGFNPIFCDVCPDDGNVSVDRIAEKMDPGVRGVLVPHMYGNPVQEIVEISSFCHERDLFLIEDCASAMGADLPGGKKVGTVGDYSIYSTGYAKTVDLGIGGVVTSDNCLSDLVKFENELPDHSSEIHEKERLFSSRYRQWRNSGQRLAKSAWEPFFCHSDFHDLFLFKIDDDVKAHITHGIEKKLAYEIARRRENHGIYYECLKELSSIRIYRYHEGAVPWRFSLFVPTQKRRQVVDLLLGEKIPVSDWYPSVTQLFNDSCSCLTAEEMGSTILNFPLTLSSDEIIHTCNQIVETIKKVL